MDAQKNFIRQLEYFNKRFGEQDYRYHCTLISGGIQLTLYYRDHEIATVQVFDTEEREATIDESFQMMSNVLIEVGLKHYQETLDRDSLHLKQKS